MNQRTDISNHHLHLLRIQEQEAKEKYEGIRFRRLSLENAINIQADANAKKNE